MPVTKTANAALGAALIGANIGGFVGGIRAGSLTTDERKKLRKKYHLEDDAIPEQENSLRGIVGGAAGGLAGSLVGGAGYAAGRTYINKAIEKATKHIVPHGKSFKEISQAAYEQSRIANDLLKKSKLLRAIDKASTVSGILAPILGIGAGTWYATNKYAS